MAFAVRRPFLAAAGQRSNDRDRLAGQRRRIHGQNQKTLLGDQGRGLPAKTLS
jgi:hypothetical protein